MADKQVTIKMLTAVDFPRIAIENVKGIITLIGSYQLRNALGENVGNWKTVQVTLTSQQKDMLINFLTNDAQLINAGNVQEGMV